MMRIPTSPEMVKRTKCVSNNKNPVWKEEPFVFHVDPVLDNVLGWLKIATETLFPQFGSIDWLKRRY